MKIYMSYRRSDSMHVAGRLSDRLVDHFGRDGVFKDTDAIPPGDDFKETLRREIQQCDAMIVLIGADWISERLHYQDDFVRLEIETALASDIPIVPVLLNNASFPSSDAMPHTLRRLAYINAALLRPDPDFHVDTDRLIHSLESLGDAKQIDEPDQTITVFISHSTLDRTWVDAQIVDWLEMNHMKTWYAETSIQTSAQWEREILRGMESCDWFLLVMSPRAEDSEWIKDEINWAVYHRPTRMIPVIMEPCNPWQFHIRLPRIQHVDFTGDATVAKSELLKMFHEAA